MKILLTIFFLISAFLGFSQETESTKIDTVTFFAKIDLQHATKDGIYLNGYVVKFEYEELERIKGQKIKISGIVTTRKGLKELSQEFDNKGNEIIRQGRNEESKYIKDPTYRIIKKH